MLGEGEKRDRASIGGLFSLLSSSRGERVLPSVPSAQRQKQTQVRTFQVAGLHRARLLTLSLFYGLNGYKTRISSNLTGSC